MNLHRILTTAGGARGRAIDPRQMMIWGNLVTAQRADPRDEAPDLVPHSWQLIRRRRGQDDEVLAGGVLAYDVGGDGTIVYSNGSAIFRLGPDGGKERLVSERMIEQVVLLHHAIP